MTGECINGSVDEKEPIEFENERRIGVRRFDIINLMEGESSDDSRSSSVSLIRTPTSTVVVDSGSPGKKDELLEVIRDKGIKVDKVNVLVTTKADEAHTGNDDLFVHALQHMQKDDWTKVQGMTNRRIAINNRYHWIDRYLRLQTIDFIEGGALVLLAHMPWNPKLLEPSSQHLSGKVILFAGHAVPSRDDPLVREALENIGDKDSCTRSDVGDPFSSMTELLGYCDHVIPAFGPMFDVRE